MISLNGRRIREKEGETTSYVRLQVQGKNDFRPSVWKCVRMGVVRPSGNLVSRVSASRKQFAIHKGGHSV